MVKTISIQELRLHLPQVLKEVAQGMRFLLIWRSKPVGELGPISDISSMLEGGEPLNVFAKPSFGFRARKSSVKIVREERN